MPDGQGAGLAETLPGQGELRGGRSGEDEASQRLEGGDFRPAKQPRREAGGGVARGLERLDEAAQAAGRGGGSLHAGPLALVPATDRAEREKSGAARPQHQPWHDHPVHDWVVPGRRLGRPGAPQRRGRDDTGELRLEIVAGEQGRAIHDGGGGKAAGEIVAELLRADPAGARQTEGHEVEAILPKTREEGRGGVDAGALGDIQDPRPRGAGGTDGAVQGLRA